MISSEDTQKMDELSLRQLQLKEIRSMLMLPPDTSHEYVIRKLYEIGLHDNRINRGAIPERYENYGWTNCAARLFDQAAKRAANGH